MFNGDELAVYTVIFSLPGSTWDAKNGLSIAINLQGDALRHTSTVPEKKINK